MGVFKNEVGRPSNETKKKRLILGILIGFISLSLIFGLCYWLTNYDISINKKNDSNESKEEEKVTTTIPTTTNKEQVVKKINIYGLTEEKTDWHEKRMFISAESKKIDGKALGLIGTYECKTENCILKDQYSGDLKTVVIVDEDFIVYNFKTKEKKTMQLGKSKDKLNYVIDEKYMCEGLGSLCITSQVINGETYYEFDMQTDEESSLGLIAPDLTPIYLLTDDVMNKEESWNEYYHDLKIINNKELVYFQKNKYYRYDIKNERISSSKSYKSVVLIDDKGYIVVVDTDNYLKVLDIEGNVKGNLAKITDDMTIHSLLSGWFEQDKKEGIYIVVQDKNVTYDDLDKKYQDLMGEGDKDTMDYGYEYYYIPSTNEVGKIAMYIGGYAKPVLYLYPKEDNTKVTVKFARPELLTTTYPKYKNTWEVTANKNGDLYDKNNKYYYGLYWEENGSIKVDFSEGFYVTKDNAIEFLEEKLTKIGLNDKERNEFIMYWLPILERNEKNLVYFELTESRENYNKLIINPKPDSLLRIAIHIKKVDKKQNIKKQNLPTFERKGFTAVEWGGVIH